MEIEVEKTHVVKHDCIALRKICAEDMEDTESSAGRLIERRKAECTCMLANAAYLLENA